MSSDRSYIVSFSFLVLFAFFVLVWILRGFVPSSGVTNQEQGVLEPATSISDSFVTPGNALQAPRILPGDPVAGPEGARVTIIQFSDFECPFCREAHDIVMDVQKEYPDDVRVVWKDFPLPQHKRARALAFAARCAKEQEKFWEFADRAFDAAIRQCVNESNERCEDEVFVAEEIGLNMVTFQSCVEENRYESAVGESMNQGIQADISGVPYVFVNQRVISGLPTREQLKALVKAEIAK